MVPKFALRGSGNKGEVGKIPPDILAEWFGISKRQVINIVGGWKWKRVA